MLRRFCESSRPSKLPKAATGSSGESSPHIACISRPQEANQQPTTRIPESAALDTILEDLQQNTAGRAKMDACVTRQR
jgi:hypothetical protein